MANVAFKKGLLASLPSAISAGTFYVTTDERALYLDINDSERIRFGDFQSFANLTALNANTNPSTTALYYVEDMNCLAKWDGTKYVQINLDTGMTSVTVTGDGNVITAASYDAATRKLTLTKGITAATQEYVGAIPDGYSETNIVAYINKKAEETLASAQGGSSETAASVKAALDTYKAETNPRLEALEAVDHEHTNKDVLDGITAQNITDWNDAVTKEHEHANKAELDLIATGDKAKWDAATEKAHEHTFVESELNKIADGDVAKWNAAVTGLADEISRAQGEEAKNAQAAADALAEAQAKVASVTAGDASVTVGGTATAPTVAAKLSQDADNALELAEDGLKVVIPAAAEYSIVKAADSGDYAAVYNLTKDGTIVGASINIPKDLVVKSGSVVGDEIVLVLNDEAATEIKIPVASLIEYVTSGSQAGDMVVINVSDDHKVTATITDGTITLAKLSTDVQTAIGKAHTHENADVLAGISADDVAKWDAAQAAAEATASAALSAAKTELEGKITAASGAAAAAQSKADEAYELAGTKATMAEVEAKGYATETKAGELATAAENAAKAHADGLNTAMNTRVAALEAIDHDAYKGYADQAEADAISAANAYADGLADNYDVKGSAATAETNAKAYADGLVLTWGSF